MNFPRANPGSCAGVYGGRLIPPKSGGAENMSRVPFLSCTVSLGNAKKWCYQINQNSLYSGVCNTPLQFIQFLIKYRPNTQKTVGAGSKPARYNDKGTNNSGRFGTCPYKSSQTPHLPSRTHTIHTKTVAIHSRSHTIHTKTLTIHSHSLAIHTKTVTIHTKTHTIHFDSKIFSKYHF